MSATRRIVIHGDPLPFMTDAIAGGLGTHVGLGELPEGLVLDHRNDRRELQRILGRLAVDLAASVPDVKGLSYRNLRYMTAMVRGWGGGENVPQPVAHPWRTGAPRPPTGTGGDQSSQASVGEQRRRGAVGRSK
ncbi:MAG TPA: hypothetical protein VJQ61_07840 [Sinomonas sp.]|nr:hypothetical protein [Sinomonas sp.]